MASADLYIFTLSNTRYIVRNVTLEMKCEDNIKSHLANAGLVQAADQYDLIFGAIKWHNDDTLQKFITDNNLPDPRNIGRDGRHSFARCMKIRFRSPQASAPSEENVGNPEEGNGGRLTGGGKKKKKSKKRQTKGKKKKRKTKRRKTKRRRTKRRR